MYIMGFNDKLVLPYLANVCRILYFTSSRAFCLAQEDTASRHSGRSSLPQDRRDKSVDIVIQGTTGDITQELKFIFFGVFVMCTVYYLGVVPAFRGLVQ